MKEHLIWMINQFMNNAQTAEEFANDLLEAFAQSAIDPTESPSEAEAETGGTHD